MHDGVSWKVLTPIMLVIAGVLGWHTVVLSEHSERITVVRTNVELSAPRLKSIEDKIDRIWERLR